MGMSLRVERQAWATARAPQLAISEGIGWDKRFKGR